VEAVPQNVIVMPDRLMSQHEYIFGTGKTTGSKIIDVKSKDDFPNLMNAAVGGATKNDEGSGPLWNAPQTKKGFGKKAQ